MNKKLILSLGLVSMIISGCSQKSPEIDSGVGINAGIDQSVMEGLGNDTIDAGIDGMAQVGTSVEDFGGDGSIGSIDSQLKPIYFGTDRYDISATEAEKIDHDAAILNSDMARDMKVRVEGNCDEWGTDEYNYALGLKRARSTKRALEVAGVDGGRISIISFGESKPICTEHNSECWQQNRRADIKVMP
jgi:peptidoglycan-associated lipoprotein